MLTIIQIILFEIWITRNTINTIKLKYHKTIKIKINTQLQNIQTHYKYRRINGTLNIFQELFCIKQAIAKIENKTLIIVL